MRYYHVLAHRARRHEIVVGWDEFLSTFFIQVVDIAVAKFNAAIYARMDCFTPDYPEWHNLGAALEEEIVFLRGTAPKEMGLSDLSKALAPWGCFEPRELCHLLLDRTEGSYATPEERREIADARRECD